MMEVLSHFGAKEILYLLSQKPHRFKELSASLQGISKSTIVHRLEELAKVNLVQSIPNVEQRYFEYALTETGVKVAEVTNEMLKFYHKVEEMTAQS
jgi:DNA-binding HxlR family transcriptional regulator